MGNLYENYQLYSSSIAMLMQVVLISCIGIN